MDRLRNTIKLLPLRVARSDRRTQLIALAPVDGASGTEMALGLGNSFARTGLKTLVIDAAFPAAELPSESAGWRDALAGQSVQPSVVADNLALLPIGQDMAVTCSAIGTAQLRAVLADLSAAFDVVLIGCGGLDRAISTELILAECNFALTLLIPADRTASLAQRLHRFEDLPRQGGAVIFTHAAPNDPGLAR